MVAALLQMISKALDVFLQIMLMPYDLLPADDVDGTNFLATDEVDGIGSIAADDIDGIVYIAYLLFGIQIHLFY